MERKLHFKCPDCDKKLAPVNGMQVATQIIKRTCQTADCKAKWQIKVEPLKATVGMFIDSGSFTRL